MLGLFLLELKRHKKKLFKTTTQPHKLKLMEYEDQWCLGLFLLEFKTRRIVVERH